MKQNINTPSIALIAALDEQNAIGRNGNLLCHLPNDLKHFKRVTTGHTVIMGRKTFESLPKGALPYRTNIVITSAHEDHFPGCKVVRSFDEALSLCKSEEQVFVIGGGMLYEATLSRAEKLYITRIHHTFKDVDTFFPPIDPAVWDIKESKSYSADETHPYRYTFIDYIRKAHHLHE